MKWIFGALLIIVPLSLADECHTICKVDWKLFSPVIANTGPPYTCPGQKFHTVCKVDCSGCSKPGVCLSKINVGDSPNTIYLNKTYTPNRPLCFLNGTICEGLKCTDPKKVCEKIESIVPSWRDLTCQDLKCLNFKKDCKKAPDASYCPDSDTNYKIVLQTGQPPKCFSCGDPIVKPNKTVLSIPVNFCPGSSGSLSFCGTIKKVMSNISNLLGNETLAFISSGKVDGIFLKSEDYDDLDTVAFMYSTSTRFMINEDETEISSFNRSFSVPMEAFEKAYNVSNGTVSVAVFRFPNFQQDEKKSTLLDNEVFSIDFGVDVKGLANTVDLTFRNVNETAGTPTCHSWDGKELKPNWTTDGCNTTFMNNTVTCSCNHLTFFAVLMSDPKQEISTLDFTILTYITSIGCGLSIFFLGVALFRHFLLRRARASHSVHILINLILAIFLLNLTFLTNEHMAKTGNAVGCKLMAALMHYFMLSSFQWFCIEALHLCLQITKRTASIPRYLFKLQVGGWAPPAIMVACIFAAGKYDILSIYIDTQTTVNMCWITDSKVHYIVNIGYYTCVFLFTSLTFVVVLYWLFILRIKRPNIPTFADKTKPSDAVTIMGLFCMLGLGWGFALFAYGPLRVPALYIFTGLNSFQGFFLFLYYYITSKPVAETKAETDNTMVLENPYKNSKQPERVSGRRFHCNPPSNGQ